MGPYILARQNHQADEQKQYALQDWQKEASDPQEDEFPAGQQYQPPLALLIQRVLSKVCAKFRALWRTNLEFTAIKVERARPDDPPILPLVCRDDQPHGAENVDGRRQRRSRTSPSVAF